MKRVLITGGAGFIGSRLSEKLFAEGYEITVLDNLSPQIHGKDSLLYSRVKDICTFIKGDVRNKKDWERAITGQDVVVHLASETGTGQSMYEIHRYNQVNILGTSNLLDILANSDHSISKIVLASSRSIYGEGKYFCQNHGDIYPLSRKRLDMQSGDFDLKCLICDNYLTTVPTDEDSKIHPSSIYGITKQHQEQMIMLMSDVLGIGSTSLRYQNVYGPGQSLSNPYTGILSVFSTRIFNGNNLEVYEDGLSSRDFVYIDDVVDATILSIEKEESNGHVLNVGSCESVTIKQVAEKLIEKYNANVNIIDSGKFRLGDIRHNLADLNKSKQILGYHPKYSFDAGVTNFVEWVRSQNISDDMYEKSVQELLDKGLMK